MAKIKALCKDGGELYGYQFYCPGCKGRHEINTTWSFDGNFESPTISPSIHVRWDGFVDEEKITKICHTFVRNGEIQYLGDCTHRLANTTVPMEEVEGTPLF